MITNRAVLLNKPVDRGNLPLRAVNLGLSGSGGGGIAAEALQATRQVFPSLPAGAISSLENKIITPLATAKKKLNSFLSGLFD